MDYIRLYIYKGVLSTMTLSIYVWAYKGVHIPYVHRWYICVCVYVCTVCDVCICMYVQQLYVYLCIHDVMYLWYVYDVSMMYVCVVLCVYVVSAAAVSCSSCMCVWCAAHVYICVYMCVYVSMYYDCIYVCIYVCMMLCMWLAAAVVSMYWYVLVIWLYQWCYVSMICISYMYWLYCISYMIVMY